MYVCDRPVLAGFNSTIVTISFLFIFTLRAKLIVIGPVCGGRGRVFVCVCLWVCYHDNWKLRASIFTKLGL